MLRLIPLVLLLIISCGKVNGLSPVDIKAKLGSAAQLANQKIFEVPDYIEYNNRHNPSEENLQELVDFLIEGEGSTEAKAKVLHDWVVINVFYDYGHYDNNEDLPPNFEFEVLRRRLAVCSGFTHLLHRMLKMAGLRAAQVTGAAANNHIWNAVFDGEWKHIDATWNAGSYRNGTITYKYSTSYFYKTAAEMSSVTNHATGNGYDYDEN